MPMGLTREGALLARCEKLLTIMALNSTAIPMVCHGEFEALRLELGGFIRDRSEGKNQPEAVVVNVFVVPTDGLQLGGTVGKAKEGEASASDASCAQCGGTGAVDLPRRYLSERTRSVPCGACGGTGRATGTDAAVAKATATTGPSEEAI